MKWANAKRNPSWAASAPLKSEEPRSHTWGALERMVGGKRAFQMADELPDLLREAVRLREPAAIHRLRGARVAARRSSEAEVDAAGVEGLQHPEALRGAKGAVVGKEHAAGSDAQALRFGAQPRQQDLRTGIGQRCDRMMLSEPIAVVAEGVRAASERECFLDRARRAEAADDG
jgi:hypothetical protein